MAAKKRPSFSERNKKKREAKETEQTTHSKTPPQSLKRQHSKPRRPPSQGEPHVQQQTRKAAHNPEYKTSASCSRCTCCAVFIAIIISILGLTVTMYYAHDDIRRYVDYEILPYVQEIQHELQQQILKLDKIFDRNQDSDQIFDEVNRHVDKKSESHDSENRDDILDNIHNNNNKDSIDNKHVLSIEENHKQDDEIKIDSELETETYVNVDIEEHVSVPKISIQDPSRHNNDENVNKKLEENLNTGEAPDERLKDEILNQSLKDSTKPTSNIGDNHEKNKVVSEKESETSENSIHVPSGAEKVPMTPELVGKMDGVKATLTNDPGTREKVVTLSSGATTESELPTTSKSSNNQKDDISNSKDRDIQEELDEADKLLDKKKLDEASMKYDKILKRHPSSPRANHGKAQTLDRMSEELKSNEVLGESIDQYKKVLSLADVPVTLYFTAMTRLIDRCHFRGWSSQAAHLLKEAAFKYPQNLTVKNELGVAYLMSGKTAQAKDVFKQVLSLEASDGFAQAHLGFIIKTSDNDAVAAIPYLEEGLKSKAPGTKHGRFYFQLGDALIRTGQREKARAVHSEATSLGLFLSADQRSLYNVDRLTGRPWWTAEQTGQRTAFKLLEANWKIIRDEGLAQLDAKLGSFIPEEENLIDTGDWQQFVLYARGQKDVKNCDKAPKTCALIEQFAEAKSCARGQVKFSVMQPGVHVWPHTGPTNCRIRAHLGLVIPEGPVITVINESRTWKEGKFIIFDDSFEHEVRHSGKSLRLVLIVDIWHPELTDHEKRTLTPI